MKKHTLTFSGRWTYYLCGHSCQVIPVEATSELQEAGVEKTVGFAWIECRVEIFQMINSIYNESERFLQKPLVVQYSVVSIGNRAVPINLSEMVINPESNK